MGWAAQLDRVVQPTAGLADCADGRCGVAREASLARPRARPLFRPDERRGATAAILDEGPRPSRSGRPGEIEAEGQVTWWHAIALEARIRQEPPR